MRFGFCGAGYQSALVNCDAQRSVNLYPEVNESGQGVSSMILLPTAGLEVFSDLGGPSVTGQCEINGRGFGISGTNFCEMLSDGTKIVRGTVRIDTNQATISASATQLLITSGGRAYSFILATNAFAEIDTTTLAAIQGPVLMGGYADDYFIVLLSNSQSFQISAILDVTSWDPLDIAQVSLFPDNVVSMLIDHRELWLFGSETIVPYVNTGNPDFPWEPIQGAYIQQGINSPWCRNRIDNSLLWLGRNEHGAQVAWRAQGYTPVRVSTHAIEYAWSQYTTTSDAISYAWQENGHTFWQIYFPTANKTWVYDTATQAWHERTSRIGGIEGAHFSQNHMYCFGKHLVGDWNSGKVYRMSSSLLDDAGVNIRRLRRSPYVGAFEDEWAYFEKLVFDLETGLATFTDGAGNPRAPQLFVRWSDDGGHSWSDERALDCGKIGEYSHRVALYRLGRTRKARVIEASASDACPWRFVDAYVNDPGSERLVHKLRAMA